MHPEVRTFLRAIEARPEDDLPKRIYGDFLDEQNSASWAEVFHGTSKTLVCTTDEWLAHAPSLKFGPALDEVVLHRFARRDVVRRPPQMPWDVFHVFVTGFLACYQDLRAVNLPGYIAFPVAKELDEIWWRFWPHLQ